jgi:hypothetical protein
MSMVVSRICKNHDAQGSYIRTDQFGEAENDPSARLPCVIRGNIRLILHFSMPFFDTDELSIYVDQLVGRIYREPNVLAYFIEISRLNLTTSPP